MSEMLDCGRLCGTVVKSTISPPVLATDCLECHCSCSSLSNGEHSNNFPCGLKLGTWMHQFSQACMLLLKTVLLQEPQCNSKAV
ncbi:hypothetical protein FKM82_020932 [Ascaphus truei]